MEAAPPAPRRRSFDLLLAGILLAVFVAALAVRWTVAGEGSGRSFLPRPDALEYAAGAQSLAQEGTYLLRVGEARVRPRYPPGLSLLLAPALRLGVPGEALWRVVALFGAALAALLARFAWHLVAALATPGARGGPAFAAGLAGGLWALAPAGFLGGTRVMSDDAAALCAFATLGAALRALGVAELERTPGRARGWAASAGFCLATTAAIRPPVALLLTLPLAIVVGAHLRRRTRAGRAGLAGMAALAFAALLGALPPIAVTAAALQRSGASPWRFSAYALWDPAHHGPGATPFGWQHYLEGDLEGGPEVAAGLVRAGRGERSNLALGARLLLGLPGSSTQDSLGRLWPVLAGPALLVLLVAARARGVETDAKARPLALAALAWVVAHLLFWGAYYWPSGRFFVVPLATVDLVVATAIGYLWIGARGARRLALAALAVAIGLATLAATLAAREALAREPAFGPEAVRARVAVWLALDDETRSRRALEFDPVEAQALGLLPPEVMRTIGDWGELPPTPHVRILRALGRLPPPAGR